MTVEAQPAAAGKGGTVFLDPFGFNRSFISRIGGLGGDIPGPDENYGFHTAYTPVGVGPTLFTLRFVGMAATCGTLVLMVNALPQRAGAPAYAAGIDQVSLRDLAITDGVARIEIETLPDTQYALLGYIYDDTDVRAEGITVAVQRSSEVKSHSERLIEARRSVFGAPAVRSVARLISGEPATLADPVSQMCTATQFDEPAYGEWLERLRMPMMRHRKQWEFVYLMQALHRYGMLQPGARGLGFGVGIEPLPAAMAAMGCTIVATDLPAEHQDAADWNATSQHGASVEMLRRPDICEDTLFDRQVSFRPVDMTALPADLTDFDFTWSSCAYEHLGSIPAGLRFVEDSVGCLKPGGVAVHTTEFNLSSNDRTVDTGATVLFRRKDIERLALTLISRGHEVAQIKYDQGQTPLDAHVDMPPYRDDNHLKIALSEYVTTSFGIIVRRGLHT